MLNFSTGLSALTVSQRTMDLIGQNMANINTPGYHRQTALLAARSVGSYTGTGVEITQVRRLRNNLIEDAVTRSTFEIGNMNSQLQVARQLESLFAPGEGSLNNLMERFFNQMEQLSSRPDDIAQRRVVLGGAAGLTSRFNTLSGDMDRLRDGIDSQLRQLVDEVNSLAPQIAKLNEEIYRAEVQGIEANVQRDQRDQLINRVAANLNVQLVETAYGQTNVFAAGVPLVVGNTTIAIQSGLDSQNQSYLSAVGSTQPLQVTGGRAAGLLQSRNQVLPDYRNRLDTLARTLAQKIDSAHAGGVGMGGPFSFLSGHRTVSLPTVPLSQAGLAMPPSVGSVFITVTDQATGQRTLNEVTIDPNVHSIQDVASRISGVPRLQGVVDPSGSLKIVAQPGYTFEFTGRLPAAPTTSAITGTTVPRLAGTYNGTNNDTLRYTVVGSGTVGVTPNLRLEVRNGAGNVVKTLDIGQGYSPGSELDLGNGLKLTLAAGTANNNDNFTTRVVGQTDTANLLPALGVNSFFTGTTAADLRVRPDLAANPEQMAASRSGQVSDGSNLRRIVSQRDARVLSSGTQTFRQYADGIVGDIGIQVRDVNDRQTALEILGDRLEAERQSISGVDSNEELVILLQFQRSFQMAARYISVVDETLSDLMRLVDG